MFSPGWNGGELVEVVGAKVDQVARIASSPLILSRLSSDVFNYQKVKVIIDGV